MSYEFRSLTLIFLISRVAKRDEMCAEWREYVCAFLEVIESPFLQSPRQALRVQEVEATRFQENRHMKMVRLSALPTGRLYPHETFLVLISVGVRRGAVGWCTALQAERLRVRFLIVTYGIFHWHNPSNCIVILGLTQPQTEMSNRKISWGKGCCICRWGTDNWCVPTCTGTLDVLPSGSNGCDSWGNS